jgi:hypothetical protein
MVAPGDIIANVGVNSVKVDLQSAEVSGFW